MSARTLFTVAAAFNFLVGLPMLVAYPVVARLLALEGQPTAWFHIVAAVVVIFGYAYGCIAYDPVRFRPYISLGIIGKLAFVAAIYGHWLTGGASGGSAVLVTGDLVFAMLFFTYLRRDPQAVPEASAVSR